MNNFLRTITCFTFLFACSTVNAQSYTPMLGNYNSWDFTVTGLGTETKSYYTFGDTSLGGITFFKLYETTLNFPSSYLRGFVREDTTKKSLYAINLRDYNKGDSSEYLLYKFDVSVGDTLKLVSNLFEFFRTKKELINLVFDSIHFDTSLTDNRMYFFSTQFGSTVIWVEGVGSLSGWENHTNPWEFVNDQSRPLNLFRNETLLCSSRDSIRTFTLPLNYYNSPGITVDTCFASFFSGLNDNEASGLAIYPNPFKEIFNIVTKQGSTISLSESKVVIYDVNGVLVKECATANLISNKLEIDLRNLTHGHYIIEITLQDGRKLKDIIVKN